jgi:hypothetical protein
MRSCVSMHYADVRFGILEVGRRCGWLRRALLLRLQVRRTATTLNLCERCCRGCRLCDGDAMRSGITWSEVWMAMRAKILLSECLTALANPGTRLCRCTRCCHNRACGQFGVLCAQPDCTNWWCAGWQNPLEDVTGASAFTSGGPASTPDDAGVASWWWRRRRVSWWLLQMARRCAGAAQAQARCASEWRYCCCCCCCWNGVLARSLGA